MRSVLVFAMLVLVSSHGQADPSSATTSIAQIMVLEPGDSSYKLFHGAVWLEVRQGVRRTTGGAASSARARDLSDTSIQLLFASFRSDYQVTVEYVTSRVQVEAVSLPDRLHDQAQLSGYLVGAATA